MTIDNENSTNYYPSGPGHIDDPSRLIIVHGKQFDSGELTRPAHSHPRAQLVWSNQGIMKVTVPGAKWLVPTSHAIWVPGGIEHEMSANTKISTCFIFVDQNACHSMPDQCSVLHMTKLMQQLLIHFLNLSESDVPEEQRLQHLSLVILDELAQLSETPLDLPAGYSERFKQITTHLMQNKSGSFTLSQIADNFAIGSRTLERLFKKETGLTFSEWIHKMKFIQAIELLNENKSSIEIAATLGYRSTSAFIAAFKKRFGTTPQEYLKLTR
ncbi:AraC family transcriptional regulator [Vibrio salinus]|uniref:AraC family transcriptional regulator n=1 Tax=Vibrio salinus TaxID=2899784 RepID=UPI001E4F23EF|nr:helix-turn-helix transcriptional regulator [Vibrio salinus]MCE0494896.1 helix-turn-helix transcriptional regulator [Vibrio salinus]